MNSRATQQGFALVAVLSLLVVISAMLIAYFFITNLEQSSSAATRDSTVGFYAAEAGLNLRAEAVREKFLGYNRPDGTSPDAVAVKDFCRSGSLGSGDFACQNYALSNRTARTFVVEPPGNPTSIRIPISEPAFQGLNAQEYRYDVSSVSLNPRTNQPEAQVEMRFKSRLVPLFQFAVFYNKDLEILPSPNMTLRGPVHTNGDLYLNSENNTLTIQGQVTTAKGLFRGRKNNRECKGTVQIYNPATAQTLNCGWQEYQNSGLTSWNGMIKTQVSPVTVPPSDDFDPSPTKNYFSLADLRLQLALDPSGNPVVVGPPTRSDALRILTPTNTRDNVAETALLACNTANPTNPPVSTTSTFFDRRESKTIRMLEVDVGRLTACIQGNNAVQSGRGLNDSTEGGLVWHFSVIGPNSATINNYGIRLKNAAAFDSQIRGLTVVSDQPVYIQGDYNSINKKPAAVLADSLNVLSNNWVDGAAVMSPASDTTINAAFLAGTDTTADTEGVAGQNRGSYNGGVENYPRFHEDWQTTGRTLTYRGSFVSLNQPRHVSGIWSGAYYRPPIRNWDYDTAFNNAANLPPLSPRFVYLKQELFERNFER
jgi:hypothetical protein